MDDAVALQRKIRAAIPLSEAMQFNIDALSLEAIRVSAPLPPNVNIHGTGFAGSIYSLAVLTGWALCTHILELYDGETDLVVSKAEIRYRRPVESDLVCTTRVDAGQRESFLKLLGSEGKSRLTLEIEVGQDSAAILQASFVAVLAS